MVSLYPFIYFRFTEQMVPEQKSQEIGPSYQSANRPAIVNWC